MPCGGPEKACTDGPAAAFPVICDVMLVGTPTGEPCRRHQAQGCERWSQLHCMQLK